MTLPPDTLVEVLANDTRMFFTDVKAFLKAKGVRYHHVTYEQLFESSTERAPNPSPSPDPDRDPNPNPNPNPNPSPNLTLTLTLTW